MAKHPRLHACLHAFDREGSRLHACVHAFVSEVNSQSHALHLLFACMRLWIGGGHVRSRVNLFCVGERVRVIYCENIFHTQSTVQISLCFFFAGKSYYASNLYKMLLRLQLLYIKC